jgi:iron(III) transport system ATP-binding protein
LLRLLAGFLTPDEGEIRFDGRPVSQVPPHERNTGMVFQHYAVFPHLSAFDNVAYGLRARKLPEVDVMRRVTEALALVQLADLPQRMPAELSGGQQQRVALARAVVIRPGLLLMDEPLSNLDAALRAEMRGEIRRLQQQTGITTLYVTHDQEEALAVSDRLAVMEAGQIRQVGDPESVYARPASRFVAGFIGKTNFLPGEWVGRPGLTVGVRPEALRVTRGGGSGREAVLTGTVEQVTFYGTHTAVEVRLPQGALVEARLFPGSGDRYRPGETVSVAFRPDRAYLFDADGSAVRQGDGGALHGSATPGGGARGEVPS